MNVLLIDDDKDTLFLMGILFEKSEVVDNFYIESKGEDALNLLRSATTIPDCIFVDLKMPEMHGFEFVERYEQLYSQNFPNTHLYILSSSVRQKDQERSKNYPSVKEFILKPITTQKLLEINSMIA